MSTAETGGTDDTGARIERTRRALADDPRLGQLDVSITLRGRRALLTGHVVTRDRQQLLGAVVAEHLPGYEIDNATTTLEAMTEPPPVAEELVAEELVAEELVAEELGADR